MENFLHISLKVEEILNRLLELQLVRVTNQLLQIKAGNFSERRESGSLQTFFLY